MSESGTESDVVVLSGEAIATSPSQDDTNFGQRESSGSNTDVEDEPAPALAPALADDVEEDELQLGLTPPSAAVAANCRKMRAAEAHRARVGLPVRHGEGGPGCSPR